MLTYAERVGAALDLLTEGLRPYVEEKLQGVYRDRWLDAVKGKFRDERGRSANDLSTFRWDAQSILLVMWDEWNSVFRQQLGHYERSLVSELREFRNRWAHQEPLDFDDTYRIVDSVRRLLTSVNATNVAAVNEIKTELLESHVAEQVNSQIQKTSFHRNRWLVIGIYIVCCLLILTVMLITRPLGGGYLFLLAVVILIFVYLIYLQYRLEPPLLYGPRECRRCKRIIYRPQCPYCVSAR